MTLKLLVCALSVAIYVRTSLGVALPVTNSSLSWSDDDASSNSTQLSIPLPDQEHLDRFKELELKAFLPEYYNVNCAAVDLAYAYLYVLEKLWQIPSIQFVNDEMMIRSDQRELPLKVVFRQKRLSPYLMTTQHAMWAVANILRRFRQATSISPDAFLFSAYTWEVSVRGSAVGYVDTILDYDGMNANAIDFSMRNSTIGVSENSTDHRYSRPVSSVATSKRDIAELPGQNVSSTTDASSLLVYPNSQPRAIQVLIEYTSRIGIYPRDVADVMQFLTTVLMEHAATDPVDYQQRHFIFHDDDALTRPLLITFYSGCGGQAPPSRWNVTYADLVYGMRLLLLRLIKDNTFDYFIGTVTNSMSVIGVMEVLPRVDSKAGSGNITEY